MRLTLTQQEQAEQEARRWAMAEASCEALRREFLGRWPAPEHCFITIPRAALPLITSAPRNS